MSERTGDSISPRSLLMKVSIDQLASRDTQEALSEYRRLISRLSEKEQTLSELNHQIRKMHSSENKDSDEYSIIQKQAKACVEEINSLDRQIIALEQNEHLKSLYNRLLEQDLAKRKEQVRQIQEQRRTQKTREYEEFLRKRQEEREERMRNAASDMLARANAVDPIKMRIDMAQSEAYAEKKRIEQEKAIACEQLNIAAQELTRIEKEIDGIRHQLSQINADIAQLKFAFWGERKRHKQELEQIRAQLNNRLTALYKRRSQL